MSGLVLFECLVDSYRVIVVFSFVIFDAVFFYEDSDFFGVDGRGDDVPSDIPFEFFVVLVEAKFLKYFVDNDKFSGLHFLREEEEEFFVEFCAVVPVKVVVFEKVHDAVRVNDEYLVHE